MQTFNRELFLLNVERQRSALGLSQKDFAAKLGLTLSSYKRFISGSTSHIDILAVVKLQQLTGFSLAEFTGAEDPDADTLRRYRSLSPTQKAFIKAMVDFEAGFKPVGRSKYITVLIPTGNVADGMIYDTANVERVKISSVLNDKAHFGVKITTNHMHPAYNNGDILLVSREPIRDGDVGIFIDNTTSRAYIRTFRQTVPCRLEPINNLGEVFTVDPEDLNDMARWIKFGKVLSKIRE